MLDALRLLLRIEGYVVDAYNSAQAFLDNISPDEVGCVVTDIHMPDINELDLLTIMKEQRVSMPVIVITASTTDQIADAALELGAFDLFEKPLNHDKLLNSIREALECA